MSLSAAQRPLPAAEVNWDRLDKTKFFVVGAGLFSGVSAALYPISVVKTRLQIAGGGGGAAAATAVGTAQAILRAEGVAGFYRGFGTVVAGTIPGRAVYMSTLELTKAAALRATEGGALPEATRAALASSAAGMTASLSTQAVFVPIDVVSQRLMVQGAGEPGGTRYKGGVDAFRTIIRTEGVRGLYRGFGMSVVTYAPSSAVWWGSYGASQRLFWRCASLRRARRSRLEGAVAFRRLCELCLIPQGFTATLTAAAVFGWGCSWLGYSSESSATLQQPAPPSHAMVMGVQAFGGTCAGGVAALVTTPLDVIKTRLQVMQREGGGRPSVSDTVRRLVRDEGLRGFYRGLGPRWASMALWGTAMITTYEFLKRLSAKPEI
eukprot:SM000243S08573  [mRNA]  locus=s243:135354:137272:+ [translate_table: standard]